MSETFRSLYVRNYRLFAAGQAVSNTGTWMQRIAQDWLVVRLTGANGLALGITTALQFLPMLLFGLWGGIIADRLPKRRVLVATQAAMAVLALVLGALDFLGVVRVWHVFVLAFALGLATVVDNPTRQAFVFEMVGKEDLPNAVALNSATFNGARLVGPAIAGLLIKAAGTAPVFFLNALSFVGVIGGLVAMREKELFATERVARAPGQLREALRYVRTRPELLLPIVLVGFIGTFGFNFQITIALMTKQVFGLGAAAFGILSSAFAVGSFAGALLAARRQTPDLKLVVGAAIAFGVLESITGLMPGFASFFALLVPTGVFALTVTTAANASIQMSVAPQMRGRVMALYLLVFTGGTPFGAPLIGLVAQTIGPRWGLIAGGLVCVAAALAIGRRAAREPFRRSVEVA